MALKVQDRPLDLGLNVFDTETTHTELCSSEPGNYTEASSTYNLGTMNHGAGSAFGSPAAGSPNGRKVASTAVTAGTVSANGTAGFIAWTDRTNSRLHATKDVASSQAVVSGNTWAVNSIDIRYPNT